MESSLAWIPLFTWLLVHQGVSQFLESPCGIETGERIIGGENARTESASFLAAIYSKKGFMCGGTLITRRFALTAAHCVGIEKDLHVGLGAHNKSNPQDTYTVSHQIPHPQYRHGDSAYDIGLLKLSTSVVYNMNVKPICIYTNKEIKKSVEKLKTFKAFGWGLKNKFEDSEILQTITLNQMDKNECLSVLIQDLLSSQICAGSPNGDTCLGDSGGPLINKLEIKNQTLTTQLGIVSFGTTACNAPAIYTDVTSFVDWIQETINSSDEQLNGQTPYYSHEAPTLRPPGRIYNTQEAPTLRPPVGNYNTQKASTLPPPVSNYNTGVFLYQDCAQKDMGSVLRPTIYGPGFKALGVFIHPQFVITVATNLPENNNSLEVTFMGETKYEEHKVSSVFKLPEHDIALLKLDKQIGSYESLKPICMLTNPVYQEKAQRGLPFVMFDDEKGINVAVVPGDLNLCTHHFGAELDQNQFCVESPHEINIAQKTSGEIMANVMKPNYHIILLAMVSYSSDGIHVFTNVIKHTNWIWNNIYNYQ